ncbi:MAG: dTMP kinase [bacterium]|nr:dTMP kinase [bacterium]
MFVTFEGVEGSGKSTHVRLLAEHLRAAGRTVVETREPGGTPAGAAIRRLLLGDDAVPLEPLAELHLYCADRAQHVATVIRPALAAGHVVLCDRFSDSTLAYQGHARGLDLPTVRTLDALARDGLVPDVTFLLDCPPDEGLRRARGRDHGTDRFESAPLAFHERVRTGFLTLAAEEPGRFCIVDVTRAKDGVAGAIAREVERRLGAGVAAGTRS